MKSIRRKKPQKEFNPSLERTMLMNRTTKNYALFTSTKFANNQDPLWLSSQGGLGKIRKLKNAKSFAVDGGNSVRRSIDDGLCGTEQPLANRSNGNPFPRMSQ